MENKKIVMFDFDGVLIDTLPICYGINTEINENLSLEEYKDFFHGNIYKAIRPDGTPKKSHPEFETLYTNRTRELKIPEILKQTIKNLSKNYILTIVSSTSTKSIKEILDREEAGEYFSDILGADVAHGKIEKIESILNKYSQTSKNAIFITDTVGDIKEARHCNVGAIAVTWGFHDKETLEKANPEFIVDEFSELESKVLEFLK